MSVHDPLIARILAWITTKGSPIVFPEAGGTAQTYDASTGEWSGGSAPPGVSGVAMRAKSDPQTMEKRKLVLKNPLAVNVAAKDLTVVPIAQMPFVWGGVRRVIVDVETHGADATPAYWTVWSEA